MVHIDFNETIMEEAFKEGMAKPSWKCAVAKLLTVMRLARSGRQKKHSKEYIKRNRSFAMWEQPSGEEEQFVSRVMTAPPLMRRTSRLLQPLCDASKCEDDPEISRLATEAIHKSRVWTARVAWRESMEASQSLRDEASQSRKKLEVLQAQFNGARADYLKELAALRDEVRFRGDPEAHISREGREFDVTFFFDPMQVLQPHELDFTLKAIAEKLKMIFETDPRVTKTIDLGQLEKLKELTVSTEVSKLKETLRQKTAQLTDLQKECRSLQSKQAALSSTSSQAAASVSSAPVHENIIQRLEERLGTLRETHEATEKALRQQYSRTEVLTLERDELSQALQQSEDEKQMLRADCSKSSNAIRELEAKIDHAAKEHCDLRKSITELDEHNAELVVTNTKLRELVERLRQRRDDSSRVGPRSGVRDLQLDAHNDDLATSLTGITTRMALAEEPSEISTGCQNSTCEGGDDADGTCTRTATHSEVHEDCAQDRLSASGSMDSAVCEGPCAELAPTFKNSQLATSPMSNLQLPIPNLQLSPKVQLATSISSNETYLPFCMEVEGGNQNDALSATHIPVEVPVNYQSENSEVRVEVSEARVAIKNSLQRLIEQLSESRELAPSVQDLATGLALDVEKMCNCLQQLATAFETVTTEKGVLRESISLLRRDIHRVVTVVEGSPALGNNEDLKKCIALIKFAEGARSTPSTEAAEISTSSWPLDCKSQQEHDTNCRDRSVKYEGTTRFRRQSKQPQSLLRCPPPSTASFVSSQPSSQHFVLLPGKSVSPASRPVSPIRPGTPMPMDSSFNYSARGVQPPSTKPPGKRRPHGQAAVAQV